MRRSPFRTQVVALGILIVASVVGNVSLSASQARPDASIAVATRDAGVMAPEAAAAVQSEPTSVPSSAALPASGAAGQIVPAIYSWDPDVTFVFYRHVTKWM